MVLPTLCDKSFVCSVRSLERKYIKYINGFSTLYYIEYKVIQLLLALYWLFELLFFFKFEYYVSPTAQQST